MFTLFQISTMDSWDYIIRPLEAFPEAWWVPMFLFTFFSVFWDGSGTMIIDYIADRNWMSHFPSAAAC